jgi:hypothetical protein
MVVTREREHGQRARKRCYVLTALVQEGCKSMRARHLGVERARVSVHSTFMLRSGNKVLCKGLDMEDCTS